MYSIPTGPVTSSETKHRVTCSVQWVPRCCGVVVVADLGFSSYGSIVPHLDEYLKSFEKLLDPSSRWNNGYTGAPAYYVYNMSHKDSDVSLNEKRRLLLRTAGFVPVVLNAEGHTKSRNLVHSPFNYITMWIKVPHGNTSE
jgi:hypothetical protein